MTATIRRTVGESSALRTTPYGGRAGGGRAVLQAWLASRGLIFLIALLLAVFQQRRLGDMVNNWDAVHFAHLATGGYDAEPGGLLMAFFPGFPAVLKLGLQFGLPTQLTGVIVSAVCSLIAAAALLRLGGPWAAVAWLFAPTAVFTAVPYTESLFCAAAFWTWERARSGRWLTAAILAAAACTVRVSGLFLIGALFIMIITSRATIAVMVKRCLLLLIPIAVLVGYATYLHQLTGSWTAWYQAQSTGWARGLTWPWDSFHNTVAAMQPGFSPDHPEWKWVFRGEMASMIIGVVVTVWCLTKKMWAEASWVGIQVVAFSISYWFFSVNRAVLLWFPLWIMVAHWGSWRPRLPIGAVVHRILVIIAWMASVALLMIWSWLFFTGRWAS